MTLALPGPLWLVGAGNMGGAMLARWIAAGVDPAQVTVIRRTPGAPLPGNVRQLTAPPDDAPPHTIVLALKPQQLSEAAALLAGAAPRLLLSILAGVEIATLTQRFPDAAEVVRAMPNLPVAIGQGVTALHGGAGAEARAAAEALARPLGHVEWIADEAQFDAVTALAGSGPAFLFRFVDALAKGGEALGIAPDQAARLALATVGGAAAMAVRADVAPGALADRVASRGGSTREGLNVLDREAALDTLVTDTLRAAERRNAELAAAARVSP